MGKIPETKLQVKEAPKVKAAVVQEPPKKKLNCFVMPDKPSKPGMVLISTTKAQDGCYVLGWQEQSATWLVSEGTQWYAFSSKLLKVNLTFCAAFAFALLIVLWLNRRVR